MLSYIKTKYQHLSQSIGGTQPGRGTYLVLTMAIVVTLLWLVCSVISSNNGTNRVLLFDGQRFGNEDIVLMEAAFAKENLSEYTVVDQTIEVPAVSKQLYVASLAKAKALPGSFNRHLDESIDKLGMFDLPAVQEMKMKIGKQNMIAEIINSMDGLSEAAVMWDTEKVSGLTPKTITRASVTVRSSVSQPLTLSQVDAIRHLAANSIAGLVPENVVVTDTRTGACHIVPSSRPEIVSSQEGSDVKSATSRAAGRRRAGEEPRYADDGNLAGNDPYINRRKASELLWNQKIMDLLGDYIPNITVKSTVELADYQNQTERSVHHDPLPTVYHITQQEEIVRPANTDLYHSTTTTPAGLKTTPAGNTAGNTANITPAGTPAGSTASASGTSGSPDSPAAASGASTAIIAVNEPQKLDMPAGTGFRSSVSRSQDSALNGREIVTQRYPLFEKSVSVSITIPKEHIWNLCRKNALTGGTPADEQAFKQTAEKEVLLISQLIGNILPQADARTNPQKYIFIVFWQASESLLATQPEEAQTSPIGAAAGTGYNTSNNVYHANSPSPLPLTGINETTQITANLPGSSIPAFQTPDPAINDPETVLSAVPETVSTGSVSTESVSTDTVSGDGVSVWSWSGICNVVLDWYETHTEMVELAGIGLAITLIVLIVVLNGIRRSRRNRRLQASRAQTVDHQTAQDPSSQEDNTVDKHSPSEALVLDSDLLESICDDVHTIHLGTTSSDHGSESQPEGTSVSSVTLPGPGVDNTVLSDSVSSLSSAVPALVSEQFVPFLSIPGCQLANILSIERPQTSALFLSQLSPEKAGQTLGFFSAEYQTQVVQRMIQMSVPDADILDELAATLLDRLSHFTDGDENRENLMQIGPNEGLEKITRILAASEVHVGQRILSSLKQVDENILSSLAPEGFTYEDLIELDTDSVAVLYSVADENEWLLSLVGTESELVDHLLAPLTEVERNSIRQKIWNLGPTRISDVEQSRERIVALTRDLAIQGRIGLADRFYRKSA